MEGLYSNRKAQEEAQKLKAKIDTGQAGSYSQAETLIDKENKEAKSYSVSFTNYYFGQEEVRIGSAELAHQLNIWWDKICLERGFNPRNNAFEYFGYYIDELSKNALEYCGGGEVEVIFEEDKIKLLVTDHGDGFEDPNDDIEVNPDHGLSIVKKYADEFIIETNGKKFTKVPKKKKLVMTLDTDIKDGTRITMTKSLK